MTSPLTSTELTGAMFVGAERVVGAAGTFHGIDPRTGRPAGADVRPRQPR